MWHEYEAQVTPEAIYVHEMDKFECMMQASEYERMSGKNLEGFQKQERKITSFQGRELVEALWQERTQYQARAAQPLWVAFIIGGSRAHLHIGLRVDSDPGRIPPQLQSELRRLCESLCVEHISMRETLQSKGEDSSYFHAEFVKNCFRQNIDVPSDLKASLLGQIMDACTASGAKGFLIDGFPTSMQELNKFKANVSLAYDLCGRHSLTQIEDPQELTRTKLRV